MADRGVIFSAAMIRAILAGQKTQTRRLASSQLAKVLPGDRLWVRENCRATEVSGGGIAHCIEYQATSDQPGDAIQVETGGPNFDQWSDLRCYGKSQDVMDVDPSNGDLIISGGWVPSIHMPRWASRLTLIVEQVRVEPLIDISEADILAEGAPLCLHHVDGTQDGSNPHMCVINEGEPWATQSPRAWYHHLWDALHDKDGQRWEDNPDVVALTFRAIRGNIDRLAA